MDDLSWAIVGLPVTLLLPGWRENVSLRAAAKWTSLRLLHWPMVRMLLFSGSQGISYSI
jgi:hypothetical protein